MPEVDVYDELDQMIKRTGCMEYHEKVQICAAEHQDWRKCQAEVKEFKICMDKYYKRREENLTNKQQ